MPEFVLHAFFSASSFCRHLLFAGNLISMYAYVYHFDDIIVDFNCLTIPFGEYVCVCVFVLYERDRAEWKKANGKILWLIIIKIPVKKSRVALLCLSSFCLFVWCTKHTIKTKYMYLKTDSNERNNIARNATQRLAYPVNGRVTFFKPIKYGKTRVHLAIS